MTFRLRGESWNGNRKTRRNLVGQGQDPWFLLPTRAPQRNCAPHTGARRRLGELVERVRGHARGSRLDIPPVAGVYVVHLAAPGSLRVRRDAGTARYGSTVDATRLQEKWGRVQRATATDVGYIGKAQNLRVRLRALARFAAGAARNHKGGEWLWQIAGIADAWIEIIPCEPAQEEQLEADLRKQFRAVHSEWPLANRQGGRRVAAKS